MDLSGYEAGTYEDVPVVIELPDDVSMTSETVGVTVVLSEGVYGKADISVFPFYKGEQYAQQK